MAGHRQLAGEPDALAAQGITAQSVSLENVRQAATAALPPSNCCSPSRGRRGTYRGGLLTALTLKE